MNKLLFGTGASIFIIEFLVFISFILGNADADTLKVFGLITLNIIAFSFTIAGALSDS